jgi:ribonuclease-3
VVGHPSWAAREDSYERLEFLGDSVLQLVVTAELFRRHPGASEGDLTWMRQRIVGEEACAAASVAAGLPDAMAAAAPARLADAARRMGQHPSVRAALVEALIAACWLDLGPERTRLAVLAAFGPAFAAAVPGERDPKTALQERAARRREQVRYRLAATEGPPHRRVFESRALVAGQEMGSGRGSSKQASEQAAAADALARMTEE